MNYDIFDDDEEVMMVSTSVCRVFALLSVRGEVVGERMCAVCFQGRTSKTKKGWAEQKKG